MSVFDKNEASQKMNKTIASFKKDLSTLRTGRANPAMLDLIRIDVYGQKMPINQLATVTVPEPRTISIHHTPPSGRFYLGTAENDHDSLCRPSSAIKPDHDAMDDSHNVRNVLIQFSNRPILILDSVKYNRNRYTIFYNRMGSIVPSIPQVPKPSATKSTTPT